MSWRPCRPYFKTSGSKYYILHMYLNQLFTKNLWHLRLSSLRFTVLFEKLRRETVESVLEMVELMFTLLPNKAEEKSQIWHKNILAEHPPVFKHVKKYLCFKPKHVSWVLHTFCHIRFTNKCFYWNLIYKNRIQCII